MIIALAFVVIPGMTFLIILSLKRGDYLGAGSWTANLCAEIFFLKRHLDMDNWFNNQFKKLRRGLKSLRDKVASALSPNVGPAFG